MTQRFTLITTGTPCPKEVTVAEVAWDYTHTQQLYPSQKLRGAPQSQSATKTNYGTVNHRPSSIVLPSTTHMGGNNSLSWAQCP